MLPARHLARWKNELCKADWGPRVILCTQSYSSARSDTQKRGFQRPYFTCFTGRLIQKTDLTAITQHDTGCFHTADASPQRSHNAYSLSNSLFKSQLNGSWIMTLHKDDEGTSLRQHISLFGDLLWERWKSFNSLSVITWADRIKAAWDWCRCQYAEGTVTTWNMSTEHHLDWHLVIFRCCCGVLQKFFFVIELPSNSNKWARRYPCSQYLQNKSNKKIKMDK